MSFFLLFFLLPLGSGHAHFCDPGDLNIAVVMGFQARDRPPAPLPQLRLATVQWAVDLVNQSPGLLFSAHSLKLGFVLEDTHFDRKAAVHFAKSLRSSVRHAAANRSEFCSFHNAAGHFFFVQAVLSPAVSAAAVDFSAVVSLEHIPQLSTGAPAGWLSDTREYPLFARLVPSDLSQADLLVALLHRFRWTCLFAFFSVGNYRLRSEVLRKITGADEDVGFCVGFSSVFAERPSAEQLDRIRTRVLALRKHTRVAVICGPWSQALMDVLVPLGLQLVFVNHGELDASRMRQPGLEGSIFVNYKASSDARMVRRFNALSRRQLEDLPFGKNFADSVHSPADRLVLGLEANNQQPEVTQGRIAEGILALGRAMTSAARTCRKTPADLRRCLTGQHLFRHLQAQNFTTPWDTHVAFDENEDAPPAYQVLQVRSGRLQEVASWSEAGLRLHDAAANISKLQATCRPQCEAGEVRLHEGPACSCCWACRKCRENEIVANSTCKACRSLFWPSADRRECLKLRFKYFGWGSPRSWCCAVVSASGAAVGVTIFVSFLLKRQHPLVKASALDLSLAILLGLILTFVSTLVTFHAYPTRAQCVVRSVSFCVSSGLTYSALLVKTARIYRVFEASRRCVTKPRFIGRKAVLIATGVIWSVQVGLTLNLHFIYPPTPTYKVGAPQRPLVVASCAYDLPSFWAPLAFNLVLIFICSIFAFKTRKLPDNFHDTKCILVCGMSSMSLWAPVLLVLFHLQGTAVDFLLALARGVNAHLMQSCLFLPKIFVLLREARVRPTPQAESERRSKVRFSTKGEGHPAIS